MAQHSQVRIERIDDVAVVTLSRPPSNALSAALCHDISALITQIMSDGSLAGAVIASDLSVFSAGSDVGDILDPPRGHRAALQSLCSQIADAPKPVVAAIGGSCLSTGLDLALACAGRVAVPLAQFGYPDMRLGLLPAGGGAYRLTKCIGAGPALNMLLGSDAQPSEAALELGLIDQICAANGEVLVAVEMVQDLAQSSGKPEAARMALDMEAVATARQKLRPYQPPWAAQHRLLDVIEGALLLPKAAALMAEAMAFDEVARGPIARALTYSFVAHQRARSDSAVTSLKIEPMLRRVLAEVEAHFEMRGLARVDILGAMAAYGIAAPQGAALPPCPHGAGDVMPALLVAWANLGAKMLRNGVAPRADSVDLAAMNAGLMPNWRGGPMFEAGTRGALVVRADLRRLATSAPDLFTPDALWDQLISEGVRLADYVARGPSAPDRV